MSISVNEKTPVGTLTSIVRKILMFNLVCAHDERTDTDEVWALFRDILVEAGVGGLPQVDTDLDDLVIEMKAAEASSINNDGIREQLQYLSEALTPKEFSNLISGLPIDEVERVH